MADGTSSSRRKLVDAFDYGSNSADNAAAGHRGEPAQRPARQSRRPGAGRRVALVAGAVVMVVVLLVAGAFVVANNKFNLIERLGLDTRLDSAAEGAPRNYLVIGSDSRDGLDSDDPTSAVFTGGGATDPSGQRADAIMIMRVDPTAGSVDVVSVPRDLWVPISGTGGEERINTAYSGGPQQMIDTIREDFGIQIHHYMEIDFSGFKDLVDSMGGIPMWFDQPVRDLNSGLDVSDVGCVKLDGYQALAFVRARYFEELGDQGWQSDPTGDLGRMSRQQLFVRRVAQQAATEFSLTDIRGLNSLADVAVDNVTIDARLDLRQMLGLARRFSSVADESLTFHSLPTERWFTPGGADVQLLDPVAAESVLQLFRDEQDSGAAEPPPRLVPIVVLNGSGLEGQATETAVAFEAVGFTVAETGNANGGYATTVVRHGPGAEATALRAARHIAGGAAVESDDGLPPGAVIVVLGSDFTTVLDTPLDPDDPVLAGLPGFAPVTEPQGTSSVAGSDTTTEAAGGQPGGSTGDPDDNAGAVDEDPAPPRPEVPEAVLTPGQPPEGVICT